MKDTEGSRMIQVLNLVDQMDGDVINKGTEHSNRAKDEFTLALIQSRGC